jgi:hypothetical protein
MKDGTGEGDVYVSSLIGVDLGADEDGDMISSCVIVETMDTPRFVRSSRTSEAVNVALRALRAAIADNDDEPVSETIWAERAYALGISRSENPESMRAAFRRARRALVGSNQVKHVGQTPADRPTRQMLCNLSRRRGQAANRHMTDLSGPCRFVGFADGGSTDDQGEYRGVRTATEAEEGGHGPRRRVPTNSRHRAS